MKYLIIATKFGSVNNKWLTNELADHILESGDEVHVLALSWLDSDPKTNITDEDGVKVYWYKLPSLFFSKKIVIKYIKQLIFPIAAYYFYRKKLKNEKYDRIISFTPSHLTDFIVKKLKTKKTKAYLVLWDFFPYYLNDISRKSRFFSFLLKLENISYTRFEKIGVMTEKNKEFLLNYYDGINKNNVNILPIWAKINNIENDVSIREKYGLNNDDVIFIYGGAHSKVQELDNLLELAKKLITRKEIKFIFIGKGTDKERLREKVIKENISNIRFFNFIDRKDYEKLVKSCDVGLVSLSQQMTVPSFPSKSLDYLKCELPILASIDRATDYGEILTNDMKAGLFNYAGDTDNLYESALKLANDSSLRKELGTNGRKYFEKTFCVKNIFRIIKQSL